MQNKTTQESTTILLNAKSECYFQYESFQGVSYKTRSFNQLHLSGCKLQQMQFQNCTFENCTLQACWMEDIKFYNCKFINCRLSHGQAQCMTFVGCEFIENEWNKTQTLELEVNFCSLDESTEQTLIHHDETWMFRAS